MSYIELPVTTDVDKLTADALDRIAAHFPPGEWAPEEGHLEVWLVEVLARMVHDAALVAAKVPVAIFRYFGTLVGVTPINAVPATVSTTWTMVNNAGYTVPAGTVVAFRVATGLVAFTVVADIVVPTGQTATAAGAVQLSALDPGAAANGINPQNLVLVDALAFVATVTSTTVTAGGADAETDGVYLDRLVEELRLLTPRPILPDDFAVLARRVPLVQRTVAIDGYNPANGTSNNERMVAVAAHDAAGNPLTAAVRDRVIATLAAQREVNFVVHVIEPTYTVLAVTFDAVAVRDADPLAVRNAAVAAVIAYLDPARWAGGDERLRQWRLTSVVRYLEVAAVLDRVQGLDYLTALSVNGGTANVALAGVAPLPASTTRAVNPTTVVGTVAVAP